MRKGVMNMNHAGMVRISELHFGKLLIFLMIEVVKDILAVFKVKGKSFVQWIFRWGRKQ